MNMDGKILIAGTGRAGTSSLVRLLTRLGFDTGFTPERDGYNPAIRAGCELSWSGNPRDCAPSAEWLETAPRIIKSPYLSCHLEKMVEQGTKIDHVLIPVRDIEKATWSRLAAGLVWHSGDFEKEQANLRAVMVKCIGDCWKLGIPFTVLDFPKHVTDFGYLFGKLRKVWPELDRQRLSTEFLQLNQEWSQGNWKAGEGKAAIEKADKLLEQYE